MSGGAMATRAAIRVIAAAFAALAAAIALSAGAQAAGEADVDERYRRLAAELRCLVCQNQSLADSNAGLALDLKQQLRQQLQAGRSDREVIDYMTQRYGDFVLYRPPVKATTLLLWGGPLLMLLAGGLLLWRSLAAAAPDAPPTLPGGPVTR